MTLSSATFPLRNLRYHWVGSIPICLGVSVAAIVLTGSLLVGDSLRGSLRARAERQLGGVESAWVGTRLVRTSTLAEFADVAPALLLRGTIRARGTAESLSVDVPGVTVIGLTDEGFRRFGLPVPAAENGAVIAVDVEKELPPGTNTIRLNVQRLTEVPQSSLLGEREVDQSSSTIMLRVEAALPAAHAMNEFQLTPNPTRPRNLFVKLDKLQDQVLISGEDRRAIRDPARIAERVRRVNAAFSFGGSTSAVNEQFARALDLEDWGIRLRTKADPPYGNRIKLRELPYVSIECDRMLLEPTIVGSVEKAVAQLGLRSARTTSYVANDITCNGQAIPYSIVASLDPTASAPLGPFLPPGMSRLEDDQIVFVDWPDTPLKSMREGDAVLLTYFLPEVEQGTVEKTATFRWAGTIPFAGPALDPSLTPPFPGFTDRPLITEWKPPFDRARDKIRPGDIHDRYWQQYRTTPKAYITRAAGEKLFGSRYGNVTSVRVAPAAGRTVEQTTAELHAAIRQSLDPRDGGLVFEPTRERLLAASRGGTDFGLMLLMFSGMLILSALILVFLLYRLNVDRRAREVGVLLACGYTPRRVIRIFLTEGLLIAAVSAAIGIVFAPAFAAGMLRVLSSLWPDAEVATFLTLHITPLSIAIGLVSAVGMAAVTIWFSVRGLVRVPAPQLLRGSTQQYETALQPPGRTRLYVGIGLALGIGCVILATASTNPDIRAGGFFSGAGFLILVGLTLFRAWLLLGSNRGTIGVDGGLTALAFRGATRAVGRSLLTATLLAFATFVLVAVESFRKRPGDDFLAVNGGSGGYRWLVEATSLPLFDKFESGSVRDEILAELRKQAQDASGDPAVAIRQAEQAVAGFQGVRSLPFRLHGGEDASCLNLYQATQPRVIGVPPALSEERRFSFAQTEARTPDERDNPWRLLDVVREDGAIPLIAEQNTVLWQLKTFVGSEITFADEEGRQTRFRIVGTLQDSVFQGEVLISDANFRRLYPRTEGFRLFLVDGPASTPNLLSNGLRPHGLEVTPCRDRVAAYQAVISAYLTTFQLLGAFGLLLGVAGLSVVILRAIHERTGEFALLTAFGYRSDVLERLVLTENLLLVGVGMGTGLSAAIVSVVPHLAQGGSIPWARLVVLLGLVAMVGAIAAVLSTRRVSRLPTIPSLRAE